MKFKSFWNALILIGLATQAAGQPDLPLEALTPAERIKLETSSNIDDRVKVYEAASTRHLQTARALAKSQDFSSFSEHLQFWGDPISASRDDVDKNIGRKKKSRALISYEIHLRKAIGEMSKLMLTFPADEGQDWESWMEKAETARRRFVEILFALLS